MEHERAGTAELHVQSTEEHHLDWNETVKLTARGILNAFM